MSKVVEKVDCTASVGSGNGMALSAEKIHAAFVPRAMERYDQLGPDAVSDWDEQLVQRNHKDDLRL